VILLQASGGAFAAGLLAAAWMLSRQRRDPVPCFLDMCETEITLTVLAVTVTYFVATIGAGLALAFAELTGEQAAALRTSLAILGPPAMWALLMFAV
jgi:hypothetical protein